VNSEVDRMLEQAREEAEHILARAQEQATYLIEERELTRQAEELSHEIIRQGQIEADQVRRGADDYAAEVLVNLEREVMRTLKTIKGGLDLLDERRQMAEEAASTAAIAVAAYQQEAVPADGDETFEDEETYEDDEADEIGEKTGAAAVEEADDDYGPEDYDERDAEQQLRG
jgi:vacuolar-type H+-ATPase subunit H